MFGRFLVLFLPRYGLDSGSGGGGGGTGGGGYGAMLGKLFGGGGGGSGGGGGWGAPGTLPPNFQSQGVVSYTPPSAAAPAAEGSADSSGIMRPRNNASGDFWGPVVRRLLQQYLDQQRAGGIDSGGFTGARSGAAGGYGGRGGEPVPMG